MIFLPAQFVLEACVEAIYAGIKLVVVIPEHIPIFDMMQIRKEALKHNALVIGGNTAGILTPGEANLGIMPDIAFSPGRIGTVSRSGSLTYYVADTLTRTGYGETTCIGLGGDPVLGTTFDEILWLFENPAHRSSDERGHVRGHLAVREALVTTRTKFISLIRALLRREGLRIRSGSAGLLPVARFTLCPKATSRAPVTMISVWSS